MCDACHGGLHAPIEGENQLAKHTVVVVGGGAAGLLAAGMAAQAGAQVTLIEKNQRAGRKLYITGKGRCNVTNHCDAQTVMANIPRNARFLFSALQAFPPVAVYDFFEKQGVALKIERGNRVFPVSDRATDIIDALVRFAKKAGVRIVQETVTALQAQQGHITAVQAGTKVYAADRVILATGGASYPLTGSTGDGYRFAQALGHQIVPPQPSLVPLVEAGNTCQALMGLSLKNVQLTVLEKDKKIFSDFGELLFTHFGLSGPLVLSASAHMRHFGEKPYRISIDLKPALDEAQLHKRVISDFEKYKNYDFGNALGDLLPRKLIAIMIVRTGIDARTKVHSITREQRQTLVHLLKHFEISISGARPLAEAIITSGGISVKEVDPKTMQSKKINGLYFAGEVLDVDAYTGGFNLQIAWATAYVAGKAVQQEEGM